jgi:hypothetical protein
VRWILKKWCVRVWTPSVLVRLVSLGGFCVRTVANLRVPCLILQGVFCTHKLKTHHAGRVSKKIFFFNFFLLFFFF